MNRWTLLSTAIGFAYCLPLIAQEEKKAEPSAEESASLKEEKTDEAQIAIPHLAEIRLDEYVVPARMINLPIPGRTRTLQDIMDRFETWAKDEKIGAVLLDVGLVGLTLPDVEELRAGISRLRSSNKKVFAFLNGPTPMGFLLAAAADEVAIPPTGSVMIPGMGRIFPFMKGYYQLMGLEFEVISAGRYKYPGFINAREPNEYFKEEFTAILDGWFGDYVRLVAEGRGLTEDKVADAVNVALFDANQARQRGLVDVIAYQDEYRDQLLRREKMKRLRDEQDGLQRVNSLQDFVEVINEAMRKAEEARKAVGPKIAVLNARGPIIDQNLGMGFASMAICRDDFSKVIDELRRNKSIKAVVMRVDSPGGSGYASDVIWHRLRELNDEKPLVVSMGSVAGSGGYFIACPARRIFAQPTTITGSIGVLGILQCAQSLFNRMDYELAPMHRGDRALLGAPHRELLKEDRAFLQRYIDDFYSIFIERVAVTRRMPAEQVRKIAEGRIYTGRQAVELGLVDELGGLDAAIESARSLANIPPSAELRIVHYPRASSLGEMFESLGGVGVERAVEMFSKGITAARPIGFEEQLLTFSRRVQPLCWMAIPDPYQPEPSTTIDVGQFRIPKFDGPGIGSDR